MLSGRDFTGRLVSSYHDALSRALSLGLVLFAVWLLWSGFWPGVADGGVLLTGLGAVSCLAVVLIARRMRVVDPEGAPLEVTPRAQLLYAPWLVWQIVLANLDVARRILSPSLPIRPHVIHVRAGQKTDLGRVVYANSITLTPGTVTIDMQGGDLTVHALTDEAARGLAAGEMDRRVSSTEANG